MGMERKSPKEVSPVQKNSLTLKDLFVRDSPKSCGVKECSESQNEEILCLVDHCRVIYTFYDPKESPSQQDLKRVKLIRLLCIIKCAKMPLSTQVLTSVFSMLSANLFRPFQPSTNCFLLCNALPGDDESTEDCFRLCPSWSHLKSVFDILQLLLMKTNLQELRWFIDKPFLVNLLNLFRSEDPRERESLKTAYHQIYSKFTSYRADMRKAMNEVFLHYTFEDQRHCGIGDLLEILGSIINGFAVPLKEEHRLFLTRVLIPLHKPKGMQVYHRQLAYCVTQLVQKDSLLGAIVIKGILRYWPVTNCQKEVLLIGELEDVLENMNPEKCKPVALPLITRIAKCMKSSNSQVAERALYVWNKEQFVKVASQAMAEVFPVVVEALETNLEFHWSNVVRQLTENVKEMLQDMDPRLYSKCVSELEEQESAARVKEIRRKEIWDRLEMAAEKSQCV